MAEPTIQLGGGNWAGKSDNLLGYYKEGERFYKQDFTFSRSTTGTYTDSDGYIQEMPYNLLQQSNDFDTTWTKTLTTISSNEIDAPIGNEMADGVIATASSGGHRVLQAPSTSTSGTFTVFIKQKELSRICVHFLGTNKAAGFDCSDNTTFAATGIAAYPTRYTISDFGNGWSKVEMYDVGVTTRVDIYIANPTEGGNNAVWTGDGFSKIYFSSSQFVKGSSAKTYFPTTTRLNMPRVDYLNNSNGSLILEPQRSNLVTYSSDFSDSSWFKLGLGTASTAIVTTDYATSPEGLNNATRLQVDLNGGTTSSDQSLIYDALTVSSGDNTRSIYVKSNDGNTYDVYFGGTLSSYEIKEVTSEWTRIDATRNFASAGTGYLSIGLRGGTGCSDNADILIYGAQVEAGSYATTLINTSGSSVTRNADACSITDVADRIGQTEGTIFLDITRDSLESYTQRIFTLSDGTTSNIIGLQLTAANQITFYVENGGTNQVIITKNDATTANQKVKIAAAYKENDFVLYIDGTQVGVDTSGSVPTTSVIKYANANGSFQYVGSVNNTKIYNTRLSNSELATLTTL